MALAAVCVWDLEELHRDAESRPHVPKVAVDDVLDAELVSGLARVGVVRKLQDGARRSDGEAPYLTEARDECVGKAHAEVRGHAGGRMRQARPKIVGTTTRQ